MMCYCCKNLVLTVIKYMGTATVIAMGTIALIAPRARSDHVLLKKLAVSKGCTCRTDWARPVLS